MAEHVRLAPCPGCLYRLAGCTHPDADLFHTPRGLRCASRSTALGEAELYLWRVQRDLLLASVEPAPWPGWVVGVYAALLVATVAAVGYGLWRMVAR